DVGTYDFSKDPQVGETLDGNGVFDVMELIQGPTLSDWVKQEKRSWQAILARYLDAARGLIATHERGLLHRDFKPHNVAIGADDRVRLLDFGLARTVDPLPEESNSLPAFEHSNPTTAKP